MDSVHISGFYPPMASKIQYTDKFIYYDLIVGEASVACFPYN